jgi:transcriptional regulator
MSTHFRNDELTQVYDFVSKYSFDILVSQVNTKPYATHIPLELDMNKHGKDVLMGHVLHGNTQLKNFSDHPDVMTIFSGSHPYISSLWYDHEKCQQEIISQCMYMERFV